MVLVSLKNIPIWPSYDQKWRGGLYLGIRFLAITQPFLGQLGWNFWLKLSRDHYLSIGDEKPKLRCLFFILDFLGHIWWEIANRRGHHGTTRTPNDLGLQKLAHWVDLLGQLLSQDYVFLNFQRWTPLKCKI